MAVEIQVAENFEKVKVFWDFDTTGNVASYNLYWSATRSGPWTKFDTVIRNTREWFDKYVTYSFTRSDISLGANEPFYLYATEVDSVGAEGSPGDIRHISDYRDVPSQAGALNSPVVSSEIRSTTVLAATSTLTFSSDLKAIEIFNNSAGVLYLDVTGSELDIATAMIIPAGSYYTAQLNVPKDTGIQLYAVDAPADIRVVAHY